MRRSLAHGRDVRGQLRQGDAADRARRTRPSPPAFYYYRAPGVFAAYVRNEEALRGPAASAVFRRPRNPQPVL
jgi:hypothetical protein